MAPAPTTPDLALWVGPAGGVFSDGSELVSGETVCEVSRGEAEESSHWVPCDESGQPLGSKRGKAAAKPEGGEE